MIMNVTVQSIFTYTYSTIAMLAGLMFFARGALMPHHEQYLKLKHAELSPEMQFFCKIIIRVIGAYFFSLGAIVWASRDFMTICLALLPILVVMRAGFSFSKPIFYFLVLLHVLMLTNLFYMLRPL